MATLSICMPSNRPLAKAKKSIDSVLNFISGTDIDFVISDNSGDADKCAYIRSLSNSHIKYFEGPPISYENGKNAIKHAASDFVMIFSDDDIIVNLFGTPFESIQNVEQDVIGFRPGVVVFNPVDGLLKTTTFGLMANTAKERVEEYFKNAKGMNSTLFSAWRKDILLDIYQCNSVHPSRGEYMDWAIVLAFVSSGRVLEEKTTALFYNNENWSGDQTFITGAIAKLFTNAGLPAIDQKHLSLLQGIDSYILIRRKNSPVSPQEKLGAANLALIAYLKSYIQAAQSPQFTGLEKSLIQSLAKSKGHEAIFANLYAILSYLGLGEKYQHYYKAAIGKDWGQL